MKEVFRRVRRVENGEVREVVAITLPLEYYLRSGKEVEKEVREKAGVEVIATPQGVAGYTWAVNEGEVEDKGFPFRPRIMGLMNNIRKHCV